MLHFSNFKITGIALLMLVGVLFALPNFMREETRLALPGFIPSGTLNLGLDLQGGSHLLLSVDTDSVQRERLDDLTSDIRLALRGERIGYSGLSRIDNGVSVTIRDAADMEKATTALQNLAQPVSGSVLTSFEQRVDLNVENTQGQTFVLRATEDAIATSNTRTVQQSIEIIRHRVDELGTTEPTIQRQGEKRILVQVPGLDDPERLKALLGQTAKMNFHLVDQTISEYEVADGKRPPAGSRLVYTDTEPAVPYIIRRRAIVSGERLVDASVGFDPQTNAPEVNFRFDTLGGRKFGEVTQANIGRPFAIVLDEKVISAPIIQSAILGGSGRITGNFSVEEANDLAILLRAGALPAPMSILEERTVGPGLGADSVAAGRIALIVGFFAVIAFMVVSYSLFGIFANVALIANLLLIMAVLSGLQATLTLPGIAGIVLTVGMAVDANVLIFERIREELALDKNPIIAIDMGYSRALSTIFDANVTTFLAAIILFQLGSGPIRGFAITLAIGIVTSVFTAFVLTRLFVSLWLRRQGRPETLPI
ncbi:MAG: protein translocase subunit SecD [PS1 clade bacterium]|nr:protein translocase subunit SecD [PS1 clade bacterium]